MHWSDIATLILLILLSVLCVFGSTLIFAAIIYDKNLRKPVNFCVTSLAMSDLLVGMFNIPLTAASIISPGFRSSGTVCDIFGYTEMLFLVASVQSLCLISVSRYMYVANWNHHRRLFTPMRIALMIIITWSYSALICLPPLLGWSKFALHKRKAHCFVDWTDNEAYTYFCIGICFLMPIAVMIFCYGRIFWMQHKLSRKLENKLSDSMKITYKDGNFQSKVVMTQKSLDELCSSEWKPVSMNDSTASDDPTGKHSPNFRIRKCTADSCTSQELCTKNKIKQNDEETPASAYTITQDCKICPSLCKCVSAHAHGSPYTKRKRARTMNPISAISNSIRKARLLPLRKSDREITKLCMIMVLMFFVCWLPYVVTMLLEFYGGYSPIYLDKAALLIGYLNSALNSMVYGYRNKNVRRTIKTLLAKVCCVNRS